MYTQASNTYSRQNINNNNRFAYLLGNNRIGMDQTYACFWLSQSCQVLVKEKEPLWQNYPDGGMTISGVQ